MAEVTDGADAIGGSQQDGVDAADDLLIMTSDDDEEGAAGVGARLVELPSTTKKPKRMPFVRTQVRPGDRVLFDRDCTLQGVELVGDHAACAVLGAGG